MLFVALLFSLLSAGCSFVNSGGDSKPCYGVVGNLFDANSPDTIKVKFDCSSDATIDLVVYAVDAPWQDNKPPNVRDYSAVLTKDGLLIDFYPNSPPYTILYERDVSGVIGNLPDVVRYLKRGHASSGGASLRRWGDLAHTMCTAAAIGGVAYLLTKIPQKNNGRA